LFKKLGVKPIKKRGYGGDIYMFSYNGFQFQYHSEATHGDIAVISGLMSYMTA